MQSQPVVFVVDDDAATRDAIRRLAGMSNLPCETYASGVEFLQRAREDVYGCAILELKLPGLSGLQIQRHLADARIPIPLIFLSAHATLSIAVHAMRAGAFHFFEKPMHEQAIWDAIQEGVRVDEERRKAVRGCEEIASRLAVLSVKEEQVLEMIAAGKANRVIAKELGISIRTVEVRRLALMKKLRTKTPEDLVFFAICAFGNSHANGNGSRWHTGGPSPAIRASATVGGVL